MKIARNEKTYPCEVPGLPGGFQQHQAINLYYENLGPNAPIKSLAEEVADNQANAHEALKFGHNSHLNALAADVTPGGANDLAYRAAMPIRRAAQWAAIDAMMNNETPDDPSDDFLAILGSVPSGATAGTPQITIPMGYNPNTRRAQGVSIHGNALSERNLIGVAYVIEQGTKQRQPASELNPSMYRCAKTLPPTSYHNRGGCNPDFESLANNVRTAPELPFSLETESVEGLQARMTAGTLTAQGLTKAYLARIAMTNAEGPAIQAVREINPSALGDAVRLDAERKSGKVRGPLHGIPVLLADVVDMTGLPTTGGSIALQHSRATKSATLVAKLEAAGAIILGKANVSELNGVFDANLPHGYSSLGGQVMLPSDTDKTTAGSSAGSAAATAAGLAALTIGLETSTDTAQLIAPAGVAGVVGLKPTVGLVSRAGVLPVAKSQDSPGPITKTVYDAAIALEALAGPDPNDAATAAPTAPDYVSGLSLLALSGKRVAVINSTAVTYPDSVAAVQALGATTVVKTIGTPSPNPTSIVLREFKRELNAYLAKGHEGGARSLLEIINYNAAHPVEGLKYQQRKLIDAQAVDLATDVTYVSDKSVGLASSRQLIDTILDNGTPGDGSDDFIAIMVPSGHALVDIADRAGYPVLTVPAGFGTGNAGRNPIGVTFVSGAFSEAQLLAAGYAFEQTTNVRLDQGLFAAGLPNPPSVTNPSMWRCVPGSTFFSPHHCHPGDLLVSE